MRLFEFVKINESEEYFDDIATSIVSAIPETLEIWFHGSRARGDFHEEGDEDDEDGYYDTASDWDILAILPTNYTETHNYITAVKFCQNLSRKYNGFDIQVTLLNNNLAEIAADEGQLIWSKT